MESGAYEPAMHRWAKKKKRKENLTESIEIYQ